MSMIIRDAEIKDFDQLMGLLEQLWPGKSMNRDRLCMIFGSMIESNNYKLLCADKDGLIVGFASIAICQNFRQEGPVIYLTIMIVDEKYRRKGIGRSIVGRITEFARERGCGRIELESGFHRTDAHRFYEKMGFVKRAYYFSKDIL